MTPIDAWPDRLERALVGRRTLERVIVLRETASTQDVARLRGSTSGEVIVAWRQTAGRGRLGRHWIDTGDQGVAVSFVIPGEDADRLMARSAVAVVRAIDAVIAARWSCETRAPNCGIKWPNDILTPDGGKLAGILIELDRANAIVGVGVNVSQRAFDGALAASATSLSMLGVDVDRLDVIESLIVAIDSIISEDLTSVMEEYIRRDQLRGRHARFRVNGRVVEGRVLEVDPRAGIRVEVNGAVETLPAAITTLDVA